MAGNPQVIYSAAGAAQAHLLAGALRDRGFEAMVVNDGLQAATGVLPFGTASAPRVVVPESEAEEARRIALELMNERVPDKPHARRRFQFRMRTLMYVVTAVAVYLAIDRMMDWQLSANFMTVFYAAVCLFFLSEIVPNLLRKYRRRRRRRNLQEEE